MSMRPAGRPGIGETPYRSCCRPGGQVVRGGHAWVDLRTAQDEGHHRQREGGPLNRFATADKRDTARPPWYSRGLSPTRCCRGRPSVEVRAAGGSPAGEGDRHGQQAAVFVSVAVAAGRDETTDSG